MPPKRRSERIIEDFLSRLGHTQVQFEPIPNRPPDFLVDGHIAVETTILQQHYDDNGQVKGLSEDEIWLRNKMYELLRGYGPPVQNQSWWVGFHFGRPVERWNTLKGKVKRELDAFRDAPLKVAHKVQVTDTFELDFFALATPRASLFIPTGYTDEQAGGFIISELKRNLRIVIDKKTAVIAPVRGQYQEWWLVLLDKIGYGLGDPSDQRQFREGSPVAHTFDKVILVDPSNLDRYFDV